MAAATVKSAAIPLVEVVIDESIRHRGVEVQTVGEYRRKLRAGVQFPPLVLEKGTKRLVCGHHRYAAYRREYEPTTPVECILETYASELELWQRAIQDNVAHGRPLDTFDKKLILMKMQTLGASKGEIAKLLGESEDKIEDWAGMLVIVRGKSGGQDYQQALPLKHGLEHLVGQVMTEDQYERHLRCETGVNARRHAFALRRLLRNDWIADDASTLLELTGLATELRRWLEKRAPSEEAS